MADVDELVWCAFADGSMNSGTATFDPADIPEDGPLAADYMPASWTEVESTGNFADQSGGVDDEFGQYYYEENNEWLIWAYNNGVLDWVEGSQDVWIYQSIGDAGYIFSDTIDITLSGASKLVTASLAVALLAASI
jgi:hypothetical protein